MDEFDTLPENVQEFIKTVIKKIRYRKKVRADVFEELVSHFVDELIDIADAAERQQVSDKLIADFGQPELLAKLIRRGKKRCRPLWKKVLIVGSQVTCILVLLIGLRISTFYIGKPTIKIDYGKWLTEKASAGKDPNLNAKIDIDRSIELLDYDSNEFDYTIFNKWPEDMNEIQLQQAKKYLADNADVIKALRDAANKPYFWIDYVNPDFEQVPLNEAFFSGQSVEPDDCMLMLTKCRSLAHTMLLNIRFEIYNNNIDQAIDDCFVIHKVGVFFRGQPFLIEQMVGIAIEALSCKTVNDILSRAEIADDRLLSVYKYLAKIVKEYSHIINFTGEKAIRLDEIQRTFTDNGQGDGRVLAKGLRFIAKDSSSFVKGFVLGGYPGKKETIDEIGNFFNQVESFSQLTPFQCHQEQLKITSNLLLYNGIDAAYERIIISSWRFKTGRLALLTTIAIKKYQQETGQMAASLQQLVDSGYLDELPMDPFSDGPLIYKTTQDDFVLYSVGIDYKDNGGKIEYLDNGSVKGWKGDDCIFWPVRKKLQ